MRLILLALALGQTPDRNGEVVTRTPEYNGLRASAPIPAELHQRNNAGGRCVIASVVTAGRYQGLPREFTERLWAKSGVGGYSPGRLEGLINATNRELGTDVKWTSFYGRPNEAAAVMAELSRKGYPFGCTLTQADYARAMHHMVTDIHHDAGGLACLVDNNRVGQYRWMPAERRVRLATDGGMVWLQVWSKTPPAKVVIAAMSLLGLAAALLLLAAATVAVGGGAVLTMGSSED